MATELWNFHDFAAADFGVPDFIVAPLIVPGTVSLFYGPSQAGKTQFVFTMLKAMQEQSLLLGRFQCRSVPVLFVEADMPRIGFQNRVQQASEFYHFNGAARLVTTDGESLHLPLLPAQKPAWVKQARELEPELVIFDSLRKCHESDENDNATPSKVYGAARKLFPKAAFVFLHHTKKPPASYLITGDYDPISDDSTYRGASAWVNDADTAVLFHVGTKGFRQLRVTRARYAPDDILQEVTAYKIAEDGLFIEPTGKPPIVQLLEQRVLEPALSRTQAVEWLRERFPGKAKQTYYNWTASVFGKESKV